MDVVYVVVSCAFFGLAWALIKVCECLMPGGAGASLNPS